MPESNLNPIYHKERSIIAQTFSGFYIDLPDLCIYRFLEYFLIKTCSDKEDPLAFLLILCDTIQEWNRPHLNYSNAPDILLSKLTTNVGNNIDYDYTGPLDQVRINIAKNAQDNRMFVFKNDVVLKFQLHYSNEININAGVFNLWLDSTSNLQRLNMDELPFNIEIQFITPMYNDSGKLKYQMHRLRDAAMDTHMTFLHDWFPDTPYEWGSSNNAITHYTDLCILEDIDSTITGIEKKEALKINLQELSKRKLITEDISKFRSKLTRWKNFNEDRDFQGDYAFDTP